MANIIKLVKGDSRPDLVVTILDKGTVPIGLLGASLALKFREAGAAVLSCTIPGSVVDHLHGIGVFQWSSVPGALNVDPGNYEGEIEITFADGRVQTLYALQRFQIRDEF